MLDTQRQIIDILNRLERLEKVDLPGVWTTYTPTYDGATPGVTTYAADGQVGQYLRIGNWCILSGRLSWTGATGTGDAVLSLPFAAVTRTNYSATLTTLLSGYTFTANKYVVGRILSAASTFALVECANGAAIANLAVDVSATVEFSGAYEIAV